MTGVTGLGWIDRIRLASMVAIVLLAMPTAALGATANNGALTETIETRGFAVGTIASQPQNNSTVRHENPNEVAEDGDLEQVESWLSSRLAEQLTESSIQLSQGEYELAREHVDEEYRQLLGKYVDVEGETQEDTKRTEAFDRARDQQEKLVSTAEEYEATYQEYQEAKEAGNQTKARELARRLERLSQTINDTNTNFQASTRQISNQTDVDLTQVEQVAQAIAENTTTQQQDVRAAEFVETQLTVTSETAIASFVQPLAIDGRLTATNGSAISNQTVRIKVANRTHQTDVNESGRFRVVYRPTMIPLETTETNVSYLPANDSIYLGSASRVSVNLSQVVPDVHLARTPSEIAYGDPLTVTGSVTAGDIGAENVPVAVYLGKHRLGTARTNANGTFTFDTSPPALIPSGTHSLRVVVPLRDRALGSANATTTVPVRETPTELSISAEYNGDGQVTVMGQLTTAAGEALGKRSVRVRVAGTSLQTLRTDAAGHYVDTVNLTVQGANSVDEEDVAVSAVFTGQGTNLGSSEAETTIERPNQASEEPTLIEQAINAVRSTSPITILLTGVGVASLGFVVLRRWRPSTATTADGTVETAAVQPTGMQMEHSRATSVTSDTQIIREHIANDNPETAIQVAYAALRNQLATDTDVDPGATHWDVYTKFRNGHYSSEQVAAVREVVQAFERATFAAEAVSQDTAETALTAIERVWSVDQNGIAGTSIR